MKRIIVGISGATGTIYGIRMLQILRGIGGVESHLVMSSAALRTIMLETDFEVEQVEAMADHLHRTKDIAAAISSGSFGAAGMVVAPCSIRTLSGIATSYSENLLLRAADVTLKERRPLVLLVRETPLHLGHLKLLVQVAEMGAVVMPPMPAFYHRPSSLEDIIDQTINRTLDMLGIELEHDLFPRWQGPLDEGRPSKSRCRSVSSDWKPVADKLSSTPPRRSNVPIEKSAAKTLGLETADQKDSN